MVWHFKPQARAYRFVGHKVAIITVEPLNNRHIGMDHLFHYREVVLFWRQNCIATVYVGALESVLYSECPLSEVPLYHDVANIKYTHCV